MKKEPRLFYDNRWDGPTGIGRFSREITRLKPDDLGDLIPINPKCGLGTPFNVIEISKSLKSLGWKDNDLFISPGFFPPLFWHQDDLNRCVISIHDLTHLDAYPWYYGIYYKKILAPIYRRCARIITVSEFSKGQLVARLGISPEKITVVNNAVSEDFLAGAAQEKQDFFPLSGVKYFFYAGNSRPYKNVDVLMDAFNKSGLWKENGFKLVLTGAPSQALSKKMKSLECEKDIFYVGTVEEKLLSALYRNCFAFCYLSSCEGFGIPILEAMANRVPVLAAKKTSLPEVGGSAALYIDDPTSSQEVSNALRKIVSDDVLRQSMSEKGPSNASRFSWEKSGRVFWEAIRDVISHDP